jgi:7-cyano-7-deazaguanine synthase in queuosine biosynthesis
MVIDTLLMFSGGLDSTGAFWQLMQDKQNIHVHHMHLKNVEQRWTAESKSTADIVELYEEHRFFFIFRIYS